MLEQEVQWKKAWMIWRKRGLLLYQGVSAGCDGGWGVLSWTPAFYTIEQIGVFHTLTTGADPEIHNEGAEEIPPLPTPIAMK